MNMEECLKKQLIKKDAAAHMKIKSSLEASERFLEEAKGNLKMKYYEACELLSYNSSFHAARALLFSKGYQERSHACLITALKSLFKTDAELSAMFNTFDQLRLSRYNVQYGGMLVTEEKAKLVLDFAEKLLNAVKKRL